MMNSGEKMTHTPDPWWVDESDFFTREFYGKGAGERKRIGCTYYGGEITLRESETNARLMAASSEMWELLLDLYNDMDVEIPSKYLDRLTDIRTKVEEGGV